MNDHSFFPYLRTISGMIRTSGVRRPQWLRDTRDADTEASGTSKINCYAILSAVGYNFRPPPHTAEGSFAPIPDRGPPPLDLLINAHSGSLTGAIISQLCGG